MLVQKESVSFSEIKRYVGTEWCKYIRSMCIAYVRRYKNISVFFVEDLECPNPFAVSLLSLVGFISILVYVQLSIVCDSEPIHNSQRFDAINNSMI